MKATVIECYHCPSCDAMYEEEEEAKECCFEYSKRTTQYRCEECHYLYDKPERAMECCEEEE